MQYDVQNSLMGNETETEKAPKAQKTKANNLWTCLDQHGSVPYLGMAKKLQIYHNSKIVAKAAIQ